MLAWLGSLIGGPIVNGLINAYKAKLSAENTRDHIAADLAKADIEAQIARRHAQRDLGIAAMSHPAWWAAWLLFVIPVGLYNAAIFMLSTFGIPPCTAEVVEGCFTVLQVPAAQEKIANDIVGFIFLAQGGAGVAGAVIQRLTR